MKNSPTHAIRRVRMALPSCFFIRRHETTAWTQLARLIQLTSGLHHLAAYLTFICIEDAWRTVGGGGVRP